MSKKREPVGFQRNNVQEQPGQDLEQRVDFSHPERCRQTRPLSCSIEGKQIVFSKQSWAQLLIETAEWFINEEKPQLASLESTKIQGDRFFFMAQKAEKGSSVQLSNGKWLYTNYDPYFIVTIIGSLCKHFGIDWADVVLICRPKKDLSSPEIPEDPGDPGDQPPIMNTPHSFVIKLEQSTKQESDVGLLKYIGLLSASELIKLRKHVSLEANPRKARENRVTEAIKETLKTSPELMQFKSKGLLVSCHAEELERHCYRLKFVNKLVEGILDGGHNMFAITQFLVEKSLQEKLLRLQGAAEEAAVAKKQSKLEKAQTWDDMAKVWSDVSEDVLAASNLAEECAARKAQGSPLNADELSLINAFSFKIPVEIVAPGPGMSDKAFMGYAHEISEARNNNAQLNAAAVANAKGYFEELKRTLPLEICDLVEWQSGDILGHPIKAHDVVALALIPLYVLQKNGAFTSGPWKNVPSINLVQIYSGKTTCVGIYESIFSKVYEVGVNDPVSKRIIDSLGVMKDLPELYDLFSANFQDLYNAAGGSFGKISCVKELKKDKKTCFQTRTMKKCSCECPDGFLVPVVAALHAFMEINGSGVVVWRMPIENIRTKLFSSSPSALLPAFNFLKSYMMALNFDPQKVGKNSTAYDMCANLYAQIR